MSVRANRRNGGQLVADRVIFKGSNVFSEWNKGAYVVYSYGTHFPMFAYINGVWYRNTDKYSPSTSCHQSAYGRCIDATVYADTARMQIAIAAQHEAYDREHKGNTFERRYVGSTYHRIDGWRGYSIPCGAVCGASDTGTWSDSPCPSNKVNEEIEAVRMMLKQYGIRTRVSGGMTSNVFCGKQWVIVTDPLKWQEATQHVLEYLSLHERNLRYLHCADQREAQKEAA